MKDFGVWRESSAVNGKRTVLLESLRSEVKVLDPALGEMETAREVESPQPHSPPKNRPQDPKSYPNEKKQNLFNHTAEKPPLLWC